MTDRNVGATAGTTLITVAPSALDHTQGAARLKAVQKALAGEFEVFGELGRGAGDVVVYLARDLATAHLLALRFTPGEGSTRNAGEMWMEVIRRLDETVPAANTSCPECGKSLSGWGRYCSQCGADLSGVAAGAAAGTTPDKLLRVVKAAARGRFEVLGEMSRTEGGGTVYFARDLRSGRITALRLQKQTGANGQAEQYKLAQTQVLQSAADLLDIAPLRVAQKPPPEVRLATQLQETGAPVDPVVRPDALTDARRLDRRFAATVGAAVVVAGLAGVLLLRPHPASPPQGPNASRAGSIAALTATAPPDSAEVQVGTALPAGAIVSIDGQAASGPTVRLPVGAHTLGVTAPKLAPLTQQLTLRAGQVVVWTPTLAARSREVGTPPPAAREHTTRAAGPAARHPHTPAAQAAPASVPHGVTRPTVPSAPEVANTTASTCASLFAHFEWARAFPACEREAGDGSTSAQRALATMYDRGLGADQDYGRAASWYARAADAGDPLSQYRLALLLRDGHGVRRDERASVTWLRRAADQGDANAQTALGSAYESGRGVHEDGREAVTWYLKAAEQGAVTAQLKLASLYERGGSDPRYEFEAVRWLRRAADQGDAGAQYRLGKRYADGRGVARSDADAVAWFTKAAAGGNADARDELRRRTH